MLIYALIISGMIKVEKDILLTIVQRFATEFYVKLSTNGHSIFNF